MIKCMEPLLIKDVITDKNFIHQIKWDGIRGLIEILNDGISIYTKNGINCTDSYPELFLLPNQLHAKQALLDGELVVFNKEGLPSFYNALKRNRTKKASHVDLLLQEYPVKYMVFDILELNKKDLRSKPLIKRQNLLNECFESSSIAVTVDSFSDGNALFQLTREKNLEGIVSKKADSIYVPGKAHTSWFKTKIKKKILCAITGLQLKNNQIASLSLGIYRNNNLIPIGHVSSGLTQGDLKELEKYLDQIPYAFDKSGNVHFNEPSLTCWVHFSEWTNTGTLRHPVLIGFSHDKVENANKMEIVYE